MTQRSDRTYRGIVARVAAAACLAVAVFSALGCGKSVCVQAVEAYVQHSQVCDGEDIDVPEEIDCPENEDAAFQCILECYSLPCDTPAEEMNDCLNACPQ
jgi:hypothetical protein